VRGGKSSLVGLSFSAVVFSMKLCRILLACCSARVDDRVVGSFSEKSLEGGRIQL
jgi:hypothetical protein